MEVFIPEQRGYAFLYATWIEKPIKQLRMSGMGIYRQLSCVAMRIERTDTGRITLGVFLPDPKFGGYHANQGRDASV
jgi:hypothetical protein